MQQASPALSVLIADDQQLFTEGLCMILQNAFPLIDIRVAGNGAEAWAIATCTPLNLVVTDLNMPEMDGFRLIRQLRKKDPDLRIIAVSVRDDLYSIAESVKLGVNGYLNKICGKAMLLQALESILHGKNYFPPDIMQRLFAGEPESRPERPGLSGREKDILRLICEEKTTTEIADILYISDQTVVSHRKNILYKLGVKNTAGAVYYAIRNGIID